MVYYDWEVRHYKRTSNGVWESSYTSLNTVYNIKIILASGTKKDSFSLNILNKSGDFYYPSQSISQGDKLQFYNIINGETPGSSNFVMEGIVTKISDNSQPGSDLITISGKSRTESLFETLVLIDLANGTSLDMVQEVLNTVNNYNISSGLTITWTGKPSATGYKTFTDTQLYQPAKTLIEKYASNKYTDNGDYLFYVDANSDFQWIQKSGATAATITEGTDTFKSFKSDYLTDQVVNAIVAKCGFDANGNTITGFSFDYASFGRNGAKWKMLTSTMNIASDLMANEKIQKPGSFDAGSNFPNSYPYTTYWTNASGSNDTVADDNEFNDALREEAKARAADEAEQILYLYANPRYKVKLSLPRNNNYALGQKVQLDFTNTHNFNRPLRITEIMFTEWSTDLTLVEDEADVAS